MNAILRMTINEDNWAFCPPDHYPRLIRFDLARVFQLDRGSDVVAELDAHSNLLRVCKELYDTLSSVQQHMVLKTTKTFLHLRDLNL